MIKKLLIKVKPLLVASVFATTTFVGTVNVYASTAYTGMRNISSQQIVNQMKVGWNLGNSFDGSPNETSWGNPATTQAMIDAIKAEGFNTIRIPVTWQSHLGAAPNYTIDPAWLNRIDEVMNYAFNDNMYVIINTHHEGWIVPTYANQAQVTDELTKVWTQIANRYKNYSDYLIFETMNEPKQDGGPNEWSGGTAENRDVINQYNLAAVNAIRSTGGNNTTRQIMIPTISASDATVAVNALTIPNNDSRVIVSLHMYTPYEFSMDTNGTSYWGSNSDISSLNAELNSVYNKFVKNGRAVVIGEFGTINKDNTASRVAHAEYYVQTARSEGMTPIWWDNGNYTAGTADSYGIFNRNTLTWACPEVAQAIVQGSNSSSAKYDPLLNELEHQINPYSLEFK
jgi:endoglucanase